MKIIYRYVLAEVIKAFLVILMGITVFITISNLLDAIPMISRFKPPALILFNYFLFKTPFVIVEALPFAMLLSILFAFSQLGRFNELTAMKSVGMDFYRIITPVLIFALCISAIAFILGETVVSKSYEKSNYIKDVLIQKQPESSRKIRRHIAKLGSGGRVFYASYLDTLLGTIKGVCILKIDRDFNIIERLDAKEGKWHGDKWLLYDGVYRTFEDNIEKTVNEFKEYELVTSDAPDDFIVTKRSPEDTLTINIVRLRKLIKVLKESGFQYHEEEVNLHLKIAFPLATFILALLGVSIPFLFSTTRSFINAALGFIFTVITAFFYMGFVTIGLSLGKINTFPPLIAAWIANIVFIIIGFYALYKVPK